MYSTGYSCQILMELEFSRQIFQKSSNTKFHENPSCGSRVVACGRTEKQTDRHGEAICLFSQSSEGAPPPLQKKRFREPLLQDDPQKYS